MSIYTSLLFKTIFITAFLFLGQKVLADKEIKAIEQENEGKDWIEELKEEIRELDQERNVKDVINTEKELDFIFEKWENINPQEYGKMVSIANQSTSSLLMIPAGSETPPEGDPFETLTSMRNVDKECNAIIIQSYKGKI